MRIRIEYNGAEIQVSNRGNIYDYKGRLLEQTTFRRGIYLYVKAYSQKKQKYVLVNVARAVCMAFHPIEGEDYKTLQADHIDNNPTRNVQSNLRWLTRKQNNSRKHAKMMRERNWKLTTHNNEFVKAVNEQTGETRYFKNGKRAAEEIGCSSPFVYMALEGKATTVFGWKLSYIPRNAEEVKALNEKLEQDKQAKKAKMLHDRKEKRRLRKENLNKLIREKAKKDRREFSRQLHIVLQLNMEGELIKEYPNAHQAHLATGLKGIRKAIEMGNDGGTCGGYIWRYKIERESNLVNGLPEGIE